MRINGFSGMDIDSMVTSLMTSQRAPLDKLNQQKTLLTWTRDSYREMNSKIVDFKNIKLANFKLTPSMNTNKAVISGNTNAIRAEASADAIKTGMTVNVKSLATKSYIQSNAMSNVALSTKLSDLPNSSTVSANAEGNYTLTINEQKVTINKEMTLSDTIKKINSTPKINAIASFDEVSGKLSVTAKEYGKEITLQDGGGTFLNLIGSNAVVGSKTGEVEITSSGVAKTYYPTSNSLTVNGVQLTLLAVSEGNATSTITIQNDPTKAMDTIKSFVESYNELLSLSNTKMGEERYRDYAPLSDEQKSAMKENEITQWEEKAKSGLLKNDDILRSLVTSMRSVISGHLGTLSSIGITTGQYYEGGKMYIDEGKLKAALESDPEKVMNAFQGVSDGTNAGIFSKLGNSFDSALNKLLEKAGTSKFSSDVNSIFKEESAMGRRLKDYNSRISAMQTKLGNLEARYYKQFTAMETAMSKYESQSSSLAGYLS
ncbi:flagellar filament capping protein FliD [Paenibacillus gallinarum]|uniref:Flagellar hook-associated protein 2 n=1 Tax=Paenibacillus gallinarum TaxID=2762232 RepID=A0ABR8SZS6_9BACL|nr:flagellar filament capping protein FliD [Paenibacillus gallinarum]MBD7968937.1 flagellar filament capping protein FliD [Paenibacillus gallinarum]